MRRVISLFLPTWPTDRHRRQKGAAAPPVDRPLVLAGRDGQRRLVVAADHAARMLGLRPGLPLAQAQARIPELLIEAANPAADTAALERLALWVQRRYSPIVAIDPPDGLLIDITGAAHLMGGEPALLDDLAARLEQSAIRGRAALADTVGAAHAVARFSGGPAIVTPGGTAAALAPLPIAALRLDVDTADRLRRLGFETIGDLSATPRAPLALRFGSLPGRRLDQAYGRLAEPIEAVRQPEANRLCRRFAEPIAAAETIARYAGMLVEPLCAMLETKGLGALHLDLLFHRVDNFVQAIRVGMAKPSRDAARLTRLLIDRLEAVEPGFGIEKMTLVASITGPLAYRQLGGPETGAGGDISALVDTLANRLGADRLYRAALVESEWPERSVTTIAPLAPPTGMVWPEPWPRPTRLLAPPERVETLALLPDHPPAQFTWRGIRRRIVRGDGPERLFGEWARRDAEIAAVRDYFMVEDEAGERFWLFRAGDGENPATGDLGWYLHGIFA
jgi:protein ImuB